MPTNTDYKSIEEQWLAFCKLGGLHATEEAQVMWQNLEKHFTRIARQQERERIENVFAAKAKYIQDWLPDDHNVGTINTSHYLIYEGDWESLITPNDKE